jgi:hypothetical protein
VPTRIVFQSGNELIVEEGIDAVITHYSKQLTDNGGISGFTRRYGADGHHVMVNLLAIDYLEELGTPASAESSPPRS